MVPTFALLMALGATTTVLLYWPIYYVGFAFVAFAVALTILAMRYRSFRPAQAGVPEHWSASMTSLDVLLTVVIAAMIGMLWPALPIILWIAPRERSVEPGTIANP